MIEDKFREWGVKAKIADITPIATSKEEAISRTLIWMPVPESYVIIDCCDMRDTQYAALSKALVKTDPERGLREAEANRAIEILNSRHGAA